MILGPKIPTDTMYSQPELHLTPMPVLLREKQVRPGYFSSAIFVLDEQQWLMGSAMSASGLRARAL